MKAILRNPGFWIAQVVLFVICAAFSLRYYPRAFPIVDLTIKMSRTEALSKARQLAQEQSWEPIDYQQASGFDLDQMTQTFVELSSGGSAAFAALLKEGLYEPYTWEVRHFKEGVTSESRVRFTPSGSLYGFDEKIPEDRPGAKLSSEAARKIAETQARSVWGLDLKGYRLAEASQETKLSGRVDHSLVYELEGKSIGEGKYRIRLGVCGDRFCEYQHYIKIPEGFIRKYAEMRSSNNTISAIASVAMALLYIIGGCFVGFFFMVREKRLLWKTPLLCAAIVAGFQSLEKINQLPLAWMEYDTAISTAEFSLHFASQILALFFFDGFLLMISFMAAESLSRKAFPKHPQLWRIWSDRNASTVAILGRTLGGYLSVAFFFSFVVVMYFVGTRYLHWWTPSEALYHPDSLASFVPWFTSIAHSLHAGFWEESLFRAVPLASAALLGDRFGGRKKWIAAAFILQALIFASAHANYPAQPSYARVVELILPSFMFGGLFLMFGLLPGIILHFTFDVVSFAIPIFSANSADYGWDQAMVVVVALFPLWICLADWMRNRRWGELPSSQLNGQWRVGKSDSHSRQIKVPAVRGFSHFSQKMQWSLIGIAALVCAILASFLRFQSDVPPLELDRKMAIVRAYEGLQSKGILVPAHFEPLVYLQSSPSLEDRFVWSTGGRSLYSQLLGSYLRPPYWIVRFARFDGDVVERAEEFGVALGPKGEILGIRHEFPERAFGARLPENQARLSVLKGVSQFEDPTNFREVLSSSNKLPERRDWTFVFSDQTQHLATGDARLMVQLAGDSLSAFKKFVFVPEDWMRSDKARQNGVSIMRILSSLIMMAFVIAGLIFAILSWAENKFSLKIAVTGFSGILIIEMIVFLNSAPAKMALFSTAEPRYHQLGNMILMGTLSGITASGAFGLMLGYLRRHAVFSNAHVSLTKMKRRMQTRVAAGAVFGLLSSVAVLLVGQVSPRLEPTWGHTAGLDGFLPSVAGLHILGQYLGLVSTFQLLQVFINQATYHWSRRRGLGVLLISIFALGLCGTTSESWGQLFFSTLLMSLFFILGSVTLFSTDLALIPVACAASVCVLETRQIFLHPFVGSTFHLMCPMVGVALVSLYWFRALNTSPTKG